LIPEYTIFRLISTLVTNATSAEYDTEYQMGLSAGQFYVLCTGKG